MSFLLLVTSERILAIGEAEVRDGDFFFTMHFVAHFVCNARRFDMSGMGVTGTIKQTT
jgi:hypothetical protein